MTYTGNEEERMDEIREGRKNCARELPAPAADEPTPFAASASPSVRQPASSVRREPPGAALSG